MWLEDHFGNGSILQRNERVKLAASFWNNIGAGMVIGGMAAAFPPATPAMSQIRRLIVSGNGLVSSVVAATSPKPSRILMTVAAYHFLLYPQMCSNGPIYGQIYTATAR